MKLVRNIVKCLLCGDLIESRSNYDHKHCSCGRLSVDGGTVAPRIIGEEKDYEVMYGYATLDIEIADHQNHLIQIDNMDLNIPLEKIGFNVRALNAFVYYNKSDSPLRERLGPINTLSDFKLYRIGHIRNFRYLGVSSIRHIENVLAKYGIKLIDK